MAIYTGFVAKTTVEGDDNWVLIAAADEYGEIIDIGWGGEQTASTAMRTLVQRSTSGTTPSGGDISRRSSHSGGATPTSNYVAFNVTWAAQPTRAAGNLIPVASWNAHGGVVRWLAAPGEEILIIGAEQFSCEADVGAAASSYGVTWSEH